MTHVIYNSPISSGSGGNDIVEVTAIPQPDGTVTLARADGRILSVQPIVDKSIWEWRDAGSNGTYERAKLQGTIVSYYPVPGYYRQYPIFELRP